MAATVLIYQYNGVAPGTTTNKTSGTVRFQNADSAAVGLSNPLVKPSPGNYDYSWHVYLRLEVTVAPAGSITNPAFYMSGAAVAGSQIYAYTTDPAAYPVGGPVQATVGDVALSTDAFTYTSVAPKSLTDNGTGPWTTTGPAGDFLLLWMRIDSTVAAPGTLASKTATFQWDET